MSCYSIILNRTFETRVFYFHSKTKSYSGLQSMREQFSGKLLIVIIWKSHSQAENEVFDEIWGSSMETYAKRHAF